VFKSAYFSVLQALLYTDFLLFKRIVGTRITDLSIEVVTVVGVFGYLLPAFGLENAYGSFMIAGMCATAGMFEVFPSIMNLAADFEGDRIVSYYSTLPIPTSFVFIRLFLTYSLSAMVMALWVVPVSKLVLWNQFSLSAIHVPKFLLAVIFISLLYGALILWVTSFVRSMETINSVWMRFIYPMWFLGGYQFSWYVLNGFAPKLSYINLLNPFTYVMEMIRSSMLGQEGYINFWLCLVALSLFTLFFMWHGIKRLKTKLDFI
jgi:ABC-2 type transport system permease protein